MRDVLREEKKFLLNQARSIKTSELFVKRGSY